MANSLDELLKDIMNSSLQVIELNFDFNQQDLLQKLFEKIRASHPSIKILIVSWITFLDSIPEIKLINYFNEFLPGLFNMLSDKIKDVNQCADKCLKHFLKEIDNQFEYLSSEVCDKILEIIIEQCRNSQEQSKITGFEWIFMFLQKYLVVLSNHYNRQFKIQSSYYSKLYGAKDKIQPQFFKSLNAKKQNSIETENQPEFYFRFNKGEGNEALNQSTDEEQNEKVVAKIPFYIFPKILDVILLNVNSQNEQILSLALSSNSVLIKMVDYFNEGTSLNVKNFEEVLKTYFDSKKESTLDLILNWVVKLFRKFHDEMFTRVDLFIESFSSILSDSNENVYSILIKCRYLTLYLIYYVIYLNIKRSI